MNIRQIDDRFSASGQLTADDVNTLAAEGYRGIICARPDHEDDGQPDFAVIAQAAAAAGLKAVHIPVSGAPTVEQIEQFARAMAEMDGPVLGYCRSGGRAGTLYQAITQ